MLKRLLIGWCSGVLLMSVACGPDTQALVDDSSRFGQQTLQSPVMPPLHTEGRYIVDARGRRVKLASVNWYGASDERFVVGGLDVQSRHAIAAEIARLGFNSVRLPYSDEMVRDNPVIRTADVAANPDLIGKRALDVFAAVVDALTAQHLMVIVNDHITQATWCCGANLCDTAWYNTGVPFCRVKQSEDQWIERWQTIMAPHVNNPWVVGADLRNEVRGVFLTWCSWARAAERAGNRLHAMNPNWLMVVEGYHSGDDLTHVRHRPVQLTVPNKVVYSAHVYAWFGWGAFKMYGHRNYPSFEYAMHRQWGYLLDENIAPVWVGEMGTSATPGEHDQTYWTNLMQYLQEKDVDFAYWAVNPRKPHENAVEGYAIMTDDWKGKEGDYRLRDLQLLQKPRHSFAPR